MFSSFEYSDFQSSLHYLKNIHSSWKEFVNVANMKEHEIKIQSAIWELVSTEVDYIHALKTVSEVNRRAHKNSVLVHSNRSSKNAR